MSKTNDDAPSNDPSLTLGELSDTEIEVLAEAGELPPQYKDHPAARAALGEDDGADGEDDGAGDDAGEQGKAAAAAGEGGDKDASGDADAGAADAKTAADDPQDDDDAPFIPNFRADPKRVEEIGTRLNEIGEANNDLRKQLSEGDINLDEYLSEKDKLDAERIDLVAEKRDMERAETSSRQAEEQLWDRQQAAFFRREENAVFRESDDPVMFEALNRQFLILAEQYAKDGLQRSGPQLLEEAAQKIRDRFSIGGDGKADPDKRRREAAAQRARQARDEAGKAPRTLADLPSAAESDASLGGDEFADIDAALDSGDPERVFWAETRIARMNADEAARFGTVR